MAPAYSTCLQRKMHGCGLNSVVLALLKIVVLLHQVSCEDFTIDTNECFIQNSSNSILLRGDLVRKSFTGPNGDVWNYTVAVFTIRDEHKTIFNSGNRVSIKGNHSLSLNATGNFTIASMLDVRGRSVESVPYSQSWIGGFIRTSNSCCVLGAGPGGAFSFHGGGHGGKGGGFYQDRNTSRLYSWWYDPNFAYVMGGSTGTMMFSESKPGSGGGAIEVTAHGGTLTVGALITADGYSSLNTTNDDHCAGGSAGGLIRLQGKNVVLTSNAKLNAKGGSSGFSHKIANSRCGDGGGGGVIQVLSQHDITDYRTYIKKVDVRGGQGLAKGEEGVIDMGFVFKEGDLDINTTSCTMKWFGILLHGGSLSDHTFKTPDGQMTVQYRVCTFEFISSVYIQSKATLNIKGKYSLKIESKNGGVNIMTSIILNKDQLGAFRLTSLDGKSIGPGNVTNCSATGLYGNDFTSLIGGSVCNIEKGVDSVSATGGGSIEIRADNGDVVIGDKIIADGISNNAKAGAMGGTIRLVGKQVHLKSNAYLSARASSSSESLACGGVIQVKSTHDIQGLCETKFNVSGGCNGVAHVLVSAKHSFQVQYIFNGILTINTAQCRWSHQQNSNYMVYTQEGMITNNGVCLFNFQIPIIINGSAIVELSGKNALKIYSTQGIYIGSSFRINYSSISASTMLFLGGYCVVQMTKGKGPGRGFPGIAAGGGHGGRGGNFREENKFIFGGVYGVQPFDFTGGSTGTSFHNSQMTACGGGAICIESRKNLTIDAHIKVNGYTRKSSSGYGGGSSGGTIVLGGKYVILGNNAVLEAKGSNGMNFNSSGGGGGVIAINTSAVLVGKEPNVSIATAGGSGFMAGEIGVFILNGQVQRQQYNPGVEIGESYWGCYKVTQKKFTHSEQMLEHKAIPSRCLEICREKAKIALIKAKLCACMNDETSFENVEPIMCSLPCRGTYKYQCGGSSLNIYSAYKTGLTFSTTPHPSEQPTTRPFSEPSQEFKELKNVNISGNNSKEVLEKLSTLTKESDLNGGDIQAAANIFTKLAITDLLEPKNINETEEYGKFVADTVGHLLGTKNTYNWAQIAASNNTKNEKFFSPNELLNATEIIGINLGKRLQPNEQVTVESSNLVMEIVRQDLSDFKAVTFPKYVKLSKNWQFQDSISISEEPFNQLKEQGIQQTTFVGLFYNNICKTLKRNLASDKMINSKILAVGFEHRFTEQFKNPVKLRFSKEENWKNLTNPQCSFLDFSETQYGEWSDEGFVMTSSEDDSIVTCECDHLTNFAVLMQVKEFTPSRSHQKALQMITYIGCGISLFGLALTLATFLSLETLASERTSIHKNLVVAIGLAQIIFLAGIDAVYNPIACKIVALSLHYLYMAAFTWMCCEGIHLYTKVIEVFSSETSKMKYYYMLGWGVPLIIVIISAASRMSGYGTETACWISIKHGLIWAFVGPVLIIMSINFVVMVMVIKVIIASVSAIQTPGNTSQVKAGLKGMVVLLPLLGLTWVFGLMAVNEKTVVFQYIFAIFNSLQGLFIFAFHCIGNSEVRVAYKRLHEKRTLAKMPEHSLSSGNHHREFKRRMNSRETNSTGDEDIIVTKAIRSVSDVKLSGAHDHVAMQTFGDADSGRWSLNCPSPDPPSVSYQPAVKSPKRDPRSPPVISNESLQQPKTPRESYRSNRNDLSDGRNRFVKGDQGQQFNGYQRF